jgi:hypothetical protein
MKKGIFLVISIFIVAIFSLSFAEQKKEELKIYVPPELSKLPYAATTMQISGKITAINISDQSLKVSKNFKDSVIDVVLLSNPSTKIYKDKTEQKFSSLKIGDIVIVRYTKVNNDFVAKNIEIQ